MSIWADIFDRSTGNSERREDIYLNKPKYSDLYPNVTIDPSGHTTIPVTYVGIVDSKGLSPNYSPIIGELLCVNEDCEYGRRGDIIIFNGKEWTQVTSISHEHNMSGISAETGIQAYDDTMYATYGTTK